MGEQTTTGTLNLAEVIARLKEYVVLFYENKWWMILAGIIFACIMGGNSLKKHTIYTSRHTFLINDGELGDGIPNPLTMEQVVYTSKMSDNARFNRLATLASSRRIVNEILFDEIIVDGEERIIANWVIDIYGLNGQRKEQDSIVYLSAEKFNAKERFSNSEFYTLKTLNNIAKSMTTVNVDLETGIISLIVTSRNDQLCIEISNRLYEKISEFYIENAIARQRNTYNTLKFKADSLGKQLRQADYRIDAYDDKSLGLMMKKDNTSRKRYSRDLRMLDVTYEEVIKNLENADFLLKNAYPIFQTLDEPLPPLEPQKPSLMGAIISGFVVGMILTAIFFMLKKVIVDVTRAQIPEIDLTK